MDQLEAPGVGSFDIGVKCVDGTMILREGWGAKQVLKSLLWLRRENLNRGHIYVRPTGAHGLGLVDDLKVDALARMKEEGFEHGGGNLAEEFTGLVEARGDARRNGQHASREAARRTLWWRPGECRLAPFRPAGRVYQPEAKSAAGIGAAAVCTAARSQRAYLPAGIRVHRGSQSVTGRRGCDGWWRCRGRGKAGRSGFVAIEATLAEFHIDARYDGDLHRADMAWTRHAAAMGLSDSESQAAIMEARDLAKKRSAERQREYRKTSARVC
jgi:hypothetical protein